MQFPTLPVRSSRRLAKAACALALVIAAGCSGRSCSWRRVVPFAAESGGVASPPVSAGTRAVVEIADDQSVLVTHADPKSRVAFVYLHGRCAHPDVDVASWAEAATHEGTLVALVADQHSCPGIEPAATRWTADLESIHARIQAALAAVSTARDGALDVSDVTLIGYSEGAARAELLAGRYPEHYRRLVLIGAPEVPSLLHLKHARAVAFMSGEKDRQDLMKTGQQSFAIAGARARFFELPGAAHGEFGPEGGRVMSEVLAWLGATDDGPKPTPSQTPTPTPSQTPTPTPMPSQTPTPTPTRRP